MKKYTELPDSQLEVDTPDGQLVGIMDSVQRGQGSEKNCINISLITTSRPPDGQCWVTFNGGLGTGK